MGDKTLFCVMYLVCGFFNFGCFVAIENAGAPEWVSHAFAFSAGAIEVYAILVVFEWRRDAARWRCKQLSESNRV